MCLMGAGLERYCLRRVRSRPILFVLVVIGGVGVVLGFVGFWEGCE